MNNYVDKYGMYHDRPCKNGEPSSNNGWIYTAYAFKLGLIVDRDLVAVTFSKCVIPKDNHLIRTPYRDCPPISRDEILGMAALGFLKPNHLNGWSFSPFKLPKFSLIKTIKQFLELRGKHRNYFWQNNMDQIYRFAFSVPLQDRHFILKTWGKFNLFYWAAAKIDSLFKSKNGMDWLKYNKGLDALKAEFPEDHPFKHV